MENIEFDSREEFYMYHWLDEMCDVGRILEFEKCQEPFPICEKQFFNWNKQMKTKIKEVQIPICQPQTYLPDFRIKWNPQYEGEFYMNHNGVYSEKCIFLAIDHESFIDVKGTFFGKHSSDVRFSIKQSLFLSKHNKYVQKIMPLSSHNENSKKIGLFEETFCPEQYLIDPENIYKRGNRKGTSKIKFQTKTVNEYFHITSPTDAAGGMG